MGLQGGCLRLQACMLCFTTVRQGTASGAKLPVAMTFEVCVPCTRAGPLDCVSLLVRCLTVDISIKSRCCGTDSPPLCPECKVGEPIAVCPACWEGCHMLIWSAGGSSHWGKRQPQAGAKGLDLTFPSLWSFFYLKLSKSPLQSREAFFNSPLTAHL